MGTFVELEEAAMPTWSGIRKKLEEDYLCPALRGRVRYFATTYRASHDRRAGPLFWWTVWKC